MNESKLCYVKCDNKNELLKLAGNVTAGLPYIPDWARNNIDAIDVFPVYARLQYHANRVFLGLDISNVFPEIPKQFIRDIPIFEYPVFENFILNY